MTKEGFLYTITLQEDTYIQDYHKA